MNEWQPLSTIPRDGRVVMISNGRLIQIGGMMPAGGDKYTLFYAIPMGDSYGMLNVRPDSGFMPTLWATLPHPLGLSASE